MNANKPTPSPSANNPYPANLSSVSLCSVSFFSFLIAALSMCSTKYCFCSNGISCKSHGNNTVARECEGIVDVFDEISKNPLPSVPTIQYISGTNKDKALWADSHKEIVNASVNGKYVELECGHYVHNYESERIAKDIKELLKAN